MCLGNIDFENVLFQNAWSIETQQAQGREGSKISIETLSERTVFFVFVSAEIQHVESEV
jgi:hypothetical protein